MSMMLRFKASDVTPNGQYLEVNLEHGLPVNIVQGGLSLGAADIQIGAVELKDGATDNRAKVAVGTSIVETDIAVAVRNPSMGLMADASVVEASNLASAWSMVSLLKGLLTKLRLTGSSSLQVWLANSLTAGVDFVTNVPTGAPNFLAGQQTATSAAVQLLAARTTRRRAMVTNHDVAIAVRVGAAGITNAQGFRIGAGKTETFLHTGAVFVICESGSPVVTFHEEYD